MALAAVIAFASCQPKTPEFKTTDKGPDMVIESYTESANMGGDIKFTVNLTDEGFALSTLKVKLLFGQKEVANSTIRTKEYGVYEESIKVPLMTDVLDGNAKLIFTAQNVGMGLTHDTLTVKCTRPNPDFVTLKVKDGSNLEIPKTEDYTYSLESDFPAMVESFVEVKVGSEVITLGWNGSNLVVDGDNPVPFSAGVAGKYRISLSLADLSASPLGNAAVVAVENYKQGQVLDFGGVVDLKNWTLDYDFFDVNEDFTECKFRAVDGLYKFDYKVKDKYIKVEPMANKTDVLTLSADGSGAPWVIGAGMGKPVIGPGWNTDDGAYPMAQVAPKVYQFTLTAPGMVGISSANFKFFHQKGWGGEFKKENYAEIKLAPYFDIPNDDGNIVSANLKSGKSYKITLDLTGGVNAAKVSCEEIEIASSGLDIQVNDVKADKITDAIYKVAAVKVDQNAILTVTGIDNPLGWYVDPDHLELTAEGLKFKAISGYYSFELNLDGSYVTVRRVNSEGKAATYANERAITIMGWGVAHPSVSVPLAWDSGQLITLAEIEPGVYQFTGKAYPENDKTIGGRWQSNYVSLKFFGQAGWGAEWGTVTLTDQAKQYMHCPGNLELLEGVTLEDGATYRMTVTDCTDLDASSKFNCTIDFKKL